VQLAVGCEAQLRLGIRHNLSSIHTRSPLPQRLPFILGIDDFDFDTPHLISPDSSAMSL